MRIIAEGGSLSQEEAEAALRIVMRGESSHEEIAGFLVGLRARGETLDELVGFTRVMRECALEVRLEDPFAVDLCGTGGDNLGTFNVSTAAALICAGAGVTVAKHGNRSVSSRCGSADVLEALGVRVELGKEGVEYCLEKAGIAFLFAPFFHPAMRHVMPVRKKLAIRTFFNILGPLSNPAGVRRQLVGAFNVETAHMMASILERLDADHVITVHSDDGMDEISIAAATTAFEFVAARRLEASYGSGGNAAGTIGRQIRPEDVGLVRFPIEELQGGSAEENARILHSIFQGDVGPRRDVAVLNAAFALHVSGAFDGVDSCLLAANESVDSGAALERLRLLVDTSQRAPRP